MTDYTNMDMRDAFLGTIYESAKENKDIIFLTADHGAFILEEFQKNLPCQYLNVGIAEQNMISVAAGLALSGKKVFVYSIIPFVTLRCLEQISIDICSMNLDVNIIGVGPGFCYGSDGPTHHGIQDITVMSAMPNLYIYNVTDAISSKELAKIACTDSGPKYFRIEKGKFPLLYSQKTDFSKGFCRLLKGEDITIIASGYMTQKALCYAKELKRESSINSTVIDIFRVKPLGNDGLLELLKDSNEVVVMEEHISTGGIGSMLAFLMMRNSIFKPFQSISLDDKYYFESGDRNWMNFNI